MLIQLILVRMVTHTLAVLPVPLVVLHRLIRLCLFCSGGKAMVKQKEVGVLVKTL